MAPKITINWAMNSMDLNTIDDLDRGPFPISFPFLSDMYMCVCGGGGGYVLYFPKSR